MKTRHVIGKRIAEVRQERMKVHGGWAMHVSCIVLEDGTEIVPSVAERDHDYAIEMNVYRRREQG